MASKNFFTTPKGFNTDINVGASHDPEHGHVADIARKVGHNTIE